MTPVPFPEAQQVLGKPPAMSDAECGTLPVAVGIYAGRLPAFVSCWRPSPEERAAIAGGADLYLHVVGHGMPPVLLSTRIETPVITGEV